MPQFSGTAKPAIGIVYDSDLGASIDSVLALALLHGLESKRQARIAGLTIGNSDLRAAQLCDLIEKFYQSANSGPAAIFFSAPPIGLATAVKASGEGKIAQALLADPAYQTRLKTLTDTAVPEVLIRNALTAQYDQNAAVVLAGPPVNLLNLLAMNGAKELITAKVKVLIYAGAGGAECERLFQAWPTMIVKIKQEMGAAVPFPGAAIETEFAYAPAHPVAAAYRAYRQMPYDAPTAIMTAAYYAAKPKEGFFTEANGYLSLDVARTEELRKVYVELASAKPVSRGFRPPV